MTTDPEKRLRRITNAPAKGGGTVVHLYGLPATDFGNAERFVRDHGRDVRYWAEQDQWFVWDGRRWAEDRTLKVQTLAKETIRGIGKEAADHADQKSREELLRWALKSEKAAAVPSLLYMARAEKAVAIEGKDFDQSPWLLNVENGTLDLKTGTLRPHDRSDMITKLAPVKYNPDATCPLWIMFLDQIFGSDADLIQFVQRAIGYALTGDTGEHAMFIAHGKGANGKSTLLNVVNAMLGEGYATHTPMDTFLSRKGSNPGGASPDLARLRGARFVTAVEAESGRSLNEALIKEITGGDTITARRLHKDFFEFKPSCKIFLATNHRPEIRNNDNGIWRRIKLVPFNVVIPEADRDQGLEAKLKAELPGILNWALQGCSEWQQKGLGQSEAVKAATNDYRDESDPLGEFFAARCVMDTSAKTTGKAAFGAYKLHCEAEGIAPLGEKRFGQLLAQRDGITKKKTNAARFYHGFRLGVTHGDG